MSRSYDFAVEITGPFESEEELDPIACAIDEEMGSKVEFYWLGVTENEEGTTAYFSGSTSLCGGESEKWAHQRLVTALQRFSVNVVVTNWRCTEYQEWDESYCWEKPK